MNCAVLYVRIRALNGVMHIFRNTVCVPQGLTSVRGDFDIHINPIAEKPRLDIIDAQHAGHGNDGGNHFLGFLRTAGLVDKIINALAKYGHRYVHDEHADHKGCDRIQDRDAESCPENADKASDGGQRVRSMVPRLGTQRYGIDFPGGTDCILIKHFLDNDRNGSCNQGGTPGNGKGLRMKNASNAADTNQNTDDQQDVSQNNRGDGFELFVPVGWLGSAFFVEILTPSSTISDPKTSEAECTASATSAAE